MPSQRWWSFEDYKRANHMIPRPRVPDFEPGPADPYEPSFAELVLAATGAWAFILELEADDRLTRRVVPPG